MVKRIQIQKEDDYFYQIIGIASDERIWKVCFELNNLLNLRLKDRSIETSFQTQDEAISEDQQNLFDLEEEDANSYYEDTETNKWIEYALFIQPTRSSLPIETKPFRYFFLIRSANQSLQDTQQIIDLISQSEAIRSAVDITHIKQIKQLIP